MESERKFHTNFLRKDGFGVEFITYSLPRRNGWSTEAATR